MPVLESGPLASIIGWYFSWSARYTAATIMAFNPLVYRSLIGYQLNTWILVGLLLFGFFRIWYALYKEQPKVLIVAFSFLTTLVYISGLSSPVEALYYFNGAICYQPAHAMLLILLSSFLPSPGLARIRNGSIGNYGLLIFQAGLIFLITGSNEVIMFFTLAVIGGLWLFRILIYKVVHQGLTLLFIVSVFSCLIVILSPATMNRMASSHSAIRSLSWVFSHSGMALGEFSLAWTSTLAVALWLLMLCFLPKPKALPQISLPYHILISLFLFFVLYACFFPSFIGEGAVQGRTANAIFFIFMIVLGYSILSIKLISINVNLKTPIFIGLTASVGVLTNRNIAVAWSDLYSGNASQYHYEQLARIERIKTSKSDSIWVPPLRHKPKTIFFSDIGVYSAPWYDGFYARYYGKQYIHLVSDGVK